MAGIALAVMGPKGDEGATAPKPLWIGISLGLLTSCAQALGSLFARPAMLEGADPVAAMAVRSGVGAAFFIGLVAILALRPSRRPGSAQLGWIGGSALAGKAVGMSLLMAALAVAGTALISMAA